jgi:hypothetical protein
MNDTPYVPIEELAKHFTVTVSTIRAWVRQRLIPRDTYVKIGNTYRFCIPKVVAALTAGNAREEILPETPEDDGKIPVQLTLDFNNPDEDA